MAIILWVAHGILRTIQVTTVFLLTEFTLLMDLGITSGSGAKTTTSVIVYLTNRKAPSLTVIKARPQDGHSIVQISQHHYRRRRMTEGIANEK